MPAQPPPDPRALALDFVEQRLGQFYAHENWAKLGPAGAAWVQRWLIASGHAPDLAPAVVVELQKLFSTNQAWPKGFDL